MQVPLIKGDKSGNETDYRDLLPVNMTGVLRPILGVNGYMIQFPGLTQYGTGSGIDRRGIWNERQINHYRVSGQKFISVGVNGAATELGDISGADTASLPYSFNTQAIIADGKMWLYDPGGGLNQVTDPDLGAPIDGVWVDGYYFLTDGQFIYHTDLTDETQIDPLKFATAEFMPDPSLGVAKTADNKVMVFGRYSIEYFVNAATENFAFQRVATRAVKAGIVGTHAKTELNSRWYILGGAKENSISVHAVSVGSVEKVGTREVDKIIGTYTETELSTVVLDSYSEDGYSYVVVHLPNETLLFNENMAKAAGKEQAWSIIKTDVAGDSQWRAKFPIFEPRIGKIVVGDKQGATLGFLDNTVSTHYGELAEWILFTPFVWLERTSVDKMEVETIPGHSAATDATVFLSVTYDGVTYSKEWTRLYGQLGDYGTRFIVRRLGYVRQWIGFKLRGATNARVAFARMVLDIG